MADPAQSASFTPALGSRLVLRVPLPAAASAPAAPASPAATVRFTARVPPVASYTWEVWTNLPAVDAARRPLVDAEWKALAFPPPTTASGLPPATGAPRAGDVDTFGDHYAAADDGHIEVELSVDVALDLEVGGSKEYAYTYRCVTPSGVLWLGTPGSDGSIAFEGVEEEGKSEGGAVAAGVAPDSGAGEPSTSVSAMSGAAAPADDQAEPADAPDVKKPDEMDQSAPHQHAANGHEEEPVPRGQSDNGIEPVSHRVDDALPEPADSLAPTPDLVGSSSGSSIGAPSARSSQAGDAADAADVPSFFWTLLHYVLDLLFGWALPRDGKRGGASASAAADERTPLLRTGSRTSDASHEVLLTPDAGAAAVVPPAPPVPAAHKAPASAD